VPLQLPVHLHVQLRLLLVLLLVPPQRPPALQLQAAARIRAVAIVECSRDCLESTVAVVQAAVRHVHQHVPLLLVVRLPPPPVAPLAVQPSKPAAAKRIHATSLAWSISRKRPAMLANDVPRSESSAIVMTAFAIQRSWPHLSMAWTMPTNESAVKLQIRLAIKFARIAAAAQK
jgi:hypothetical protein